MTKLAVLMDPIESIHFKKDTSLALLIEAQKRGYELFYFLQTDMYFNDSAVFARAKSITVADDAQNWFTVQNIHDMKLAEFDVILLRKDPPFDQEYLTTTYLLDHAVAHSDVCVINTPSAVRDANEKIFTTWFSEYMPPTMVASCVSHLREFLNMHGDIILKPLYAMGGYSIFRITKNDPNFESVVELMTHAGKISIMAQAFIPEVKYTGDKRVIVVDGEVVPYALARVPQEGSIRGNLAVGGRGIGVELDSEELAICKIIAKQLKQKGIFFAGLDLIGKKITEINVTSPTCVREIEAAFAVDIKKLFFDRLDLLLKE